MNKDDDEIERDTKDQQSKNKNIIKQPSEIDNAFNSMNWLVHQYFVRQEYTECLNIFSQYSKKNSGTESPYSLLIRGLIKRSGGFINESVSLFKQSYSLNQNSIYIMREIGKNFLLLGKFKMAIEIFDSILLKQENDWNSYYQKGICYMNLGQYREANEMVDQALNLTTSEAIIVQQGKLALLENNTEQAISKYEDALKYSPNNAELLTAIGSLYLKHDDSDKAFDYFNQAMKIDTKYSNALLGIASIYQFQGEFEKALVQYKLSSFTNPNSPLVWNNLGLCFFAKGKNIAATTCLKKAIYFDPFEWIIAFNLGLVYLTLKQYASAFIYMNTSANLKSDYELTFMYLGIILSELNDVYNAITYYEKAIAIKESHMIYFNYTVSLVKNEMFGNAKEKFIKFKELFQKIRDKKNNTEENQMIEETLPKLLKLLA